MGHRRELAEVPLKGCWLGTFSQGHLPFTIDQRAEEKLQESVPTLAEMTGAALRRLGEEPNFILQVEGGRVDHAAHHSDAAALMWEQLAFDEALEVCLEFQRAAEDTLVVVTTDHGNANPGLNGMGSGYTESVSLFANLRRVKKSLGNLQQDFRRMAETRGLSPRIISGLVAEGTGLTLTDEQAEGFARFLEGRQPPLYAMMDGWSAQMGQLLANHLGIGWSGTAHTSDYVPLVAVGPGAERFGGYLQNTDLFHHYLGLAKVAYRNPELPLMAECGPSAAEAEGRVWG
jgi:alkaline phosphatase